MATPLYLRDSALNGIGSFRDMDGNQGSAVATGVVNTQASGTQIQWTKTASGAVLEWISGRSPAGGWTLQGAVTFNIYTLESNMNANCGARARLFKRTAAGVESELAGGPWNDGVEFGTGAGAFQWTGTPSSGVAFAEDDRLIVRFYITNVGTMGGGYTCTIRYDDSAANTGQSYIQLTETVAFKPESTTHQLDGASSGASSVAGTLARLLALGGAAVSTSGGSGSLSALPNVGGAASGASSGVADLLRIAPLSGAASGQATHDAGLALTLGLGGAVGGQSSVTASLGLTGALAGGVGATSQATGALALEIVLGGAATGAATGAAQLAAVAALGGDSSGISTLAAALALCANLGGQAAGVATATGGLVRVLVLGGAATGSASAAGDLTIPGGGTTHQMAGAAVGSGSGQAALIPVAILAGGALGGSECTAALVANWALAGIATSTSSCAGSVTTGAATTTPLARTMIVLAEDRVAEVAAEILTYTIPAENRTVQ